MPFYSNCPVNSRTNVEIQNLIMEEETKQKYSENQDFSDVAPTQSSNCDCGLGLNLAKVVVSLTDIHRLILHPQAWQECMIFSHKPRTFTHIVPAHMPLKTYWWYVDPPCSVWYCHAYAVCWKEEAHPLSSRWPGVQGNLGRGTPG